VSVTFPEPAPAPARPIWLTTLADLALLLVGFLLLVQALGHDRDLAEALRAGFGNETPDLPVAATALDGFAPGSATLPRPAGAVVAWALEATRDPRTAITVTGEAPDALLAADRARALAAALVAGGVPAARLSIATRRGPRGTVHATLAFAGDQPGT
jgi:hypothetical protein